MSTGERAHALPARRSERFAVTTSTARVLLDDPDPGHARLLVVRATSTAPFLLTVTQTWPRTRDHVIPTQVPAGGTVEMVVRAGVRIEVSTLDGVEAAGDLELIPDPYVPALPPYDVKVGDLEEGASHAPGDWEDVGWMPHGRHRLTLYTNAPLDFQFVDASGDAIASFTLLGIEEVTHPPSYLLQVRHPGGGTDDTARACVACWHRGT